MNNQFTYPKEKIRFAILTFFFAQGLCMASWASRIPDFKDVFAANYAFYWGLILFMIPVGKFVAIPWAGYLVSKLGSRTMVQVSILGYAMSLLCVGLAHEVYLLGFLLFVSECSGTCAIYRSIRKGSKWSACMVRQSWQLFMGDGAWEPVPEHLLAS